MTKRTEKRFPREQALSYVGMPYRNYELTRYGHVGLWEIHCEGKVVSKWRECDAPGLGDVVEDLMRQRHGYRQVALPVLKALPKQRAAQKVTASLRKGHGKKRGLIVDAIANLKAKGEKAEFSVPTLAKAADCTERYVHQVLSEIAEQ